MLSYWYSAKVVSQGDRPDQEFDGEQSLGRRWSGVVICGRLLRLPSLVRGFQAGFGIVWPVVLLGNLMEGKRGKGGSVAFWIVGFFCMVGCMVLFL